MRRNALLIIAIVAIGLNVATFYSAYPQMFTTTATKARDFSAYYIGAWRLFNNPDKIYSGGTQKGDYPIFPKPATFRYAPSFLLMVAPFLVFNYQTSMIVFNFIQLFLLPVMALMIYRLLRDRNIAVVSAILVIVLLQPLPGLDHILQTWRLNMLVSIIKIQSVTNVKDTFSWSYYYNWIDGNAKVLTTFFMIACFYFGRLMRPYRSGFFLGLLAYDPRFALISLPLAVVYNRIGLRPFAAAAIGTLLASNFLVLYHSIGLHFLILAVSHPTGFYAYTWIPFYAAIGLTIVNYRQFVSMVKDAIQYRRDRRAVRELNRLVIQN